MAASRAGGGGVSEPHERVCWCYKISGGTVWLEALSERRELLNPFTTGNPFFGTKLLGFSMGRGSGALKGLTHLIPEIVGSPLFRSIFFFVQHPVSFSFSLSSRRPWDLIITGKVFFFFGFSMEHHSKSSVRTYLIPKTV